MVKVFEILCIFSYKSNARSYNWISEINENSIINLCTRMTMWNVFWWNRVINHYGLIGAYLMNEKKNQWYSVFTITISNDIMSSQ